MSNVATTNLAVSGTCAISGTVSLSQPLLSGSTCSYQGVTTTDLTTTGNVIHNVLPISNVLPTLPAQLITKNYADTINATQDARITAEEVKTQNITYSVPNARTTLTGSSTVAGLMTFTVNPRCSTIPVALTELSNKQYVDNNFTIASNSVTVTNNNVTALTTRVGITETKLTNITYTAGSGTTNVAGQTVFLNSPTISNSTSVLATAIKPKSYIDAQDLIATNAIATANTAITAIQAVNTTQTTNITALQSKTTGITAYTVPATGPLTEITSSLSLLPYTSATIMKAYTVSCQAINSLGQSTFGGVGFTTARGQFGGFGIPIQTIYFGSVTSVVGTSNLVTFATPLIGSFPKIFLQAVNGTVTLTNKTLAGFTFSATSVVNVDYWVVQGL